MNSKTLTRARWWATQNKINSYADYTRLKINAWEIYGTFKEQVSAEAKGNAGIYETLIKELVDILRV